MFTRSVSTCLHLLLIPFLIHPVAAAEVCDIAPLPLEPRLANRSFPSVFAAWGGLGWSSVLNQPHLSDLEQMAQHDLYFCCLMFDQEFRDSDGDGALEVWDSRPGEPITIRDAYLAHNPNMIFLAEIRWIIVTLDTHPPDSHLWARDEDGEIEIVYDYGLLDITHPDVQQLAINKAAAVSKCGLYDGIFLDLWGERHNPTHLTDAMVNIVRGIRAVTRPEFLVIANSNAAPVPRTAPYLNGLFLETGEPYNAHKARGDEGIELSMDFLENTLVWAESNFREPRIIALEGKAFDDESLDGPKNLRWMRAFTTLSLTFTDGYTLFKDPHGPYHNHLWYDFWDVDLGRPIAPKFQLHNNVEGLYIREFTNGWAVYNHSDSAQLVTLPERARSTASGLSNTTHAVLNLDGDMFLRIKVALPGDINGDGSINIIDLVIVALAFGTDNADADVNEDGVINVFDLVLVANAF